MAQEAGRERNQEQSDHWRLDVSCKKYITLAFGLEKLEQNIKIGTVDVPEFCPENKINRRQKQRKEVSPSNTNN